MNTYRRGDIWWTDLDEDDKGVYFINVDGYVEYV